MSRPLLIATAFAACAFVFLLYSWAVYAGAGAEANDRVNDWLNSEANRKAYIELAGQLATLPKPPAKSASVPAIMGELIGKVGIETGQMKVSTTGATPGEASRHNVRLTNVPMKTMGKLLQMLADQHGYLIVRDISMRPASIDDKAQGHWTMVIVVPAQKK
jgi:hypothetical protein